jgi:hypothetical protein
MRASSLLGYSNLLQSLCGTIREKCAAVELLERDWTVKVPKSFTRLFLERVLNLSDER